jgi:hypothetical protein
MIAVAQSEVPKIATIMIKKMIRTIKKERQGQRGENYMRLFFNRMRTELIFRVDQRGI